MSTLQVQTIKQFFSPSTPSKPLTCYHEGVGIPPEGVLQQPSENGVPVGDEGQLGGVDRGQGPTELNLPPRGEGITSAARRLLALAGRASSLGVRPDWLTSKWRCCPVIGAHRRLLSLGGADAGGITSLAMLLSGKLLEGRTRVGQDRMGVGLAVDSCFGFVLECSVSSVERRTGTRWRRWTLSPFRWKIRIGLL